MPNFSICSRIGALTSIQPLLTIEGSPFSFHEISLGYPRNPAETCSENAGETWERPEEEQLWDPFCCRRTGNLGSVMPALANAIHPLVNSTLGSQWGHRLQRSCGVHRGCMDVQQSQRNGAIRCIAGALPVGSVGTASICWCLVTCLPKNEVSASELC